MDLLLGKSAIGRNLYNGLSGPHRLCYPNTGTVGPRLQKFLEATNF